MNREEYDNLIRGEHFTWDIKKRLLTVFYLIRELYGLKDDYEAFQFLENESIPIPTCNERIKGAVM